MRDLVKKFNLPEWVHSKAAWGAIALAVSGIAAAVNKLLNGELDLNAFLTEILPFLGFAAGIVGIRFKKP